MKKKFTGFLVCLLMLCVSIFAGCNLIETDNSKMYNAVVAEIYNKDNKKVAEITNRDLISGYQSYGAQYVQYYGYSKTEAVNLTITTLENRKIALLTAENLFKIDSTGKGLSALEKNYLYDSTVNGLKENLDYYYDEIVGEETEETEENDNKTFNGYTKNAELTHKDGEYVITKIDKKDGLLDGYRHLGADKDFNIKADKDAIYTNFVNSLYNEDYEKAFEKYYNDLKSAEYGMKLSSNSKAVFEREIERLYKINYENYMVEKYNESFLNSTNVSNITTQDVLSLYSSKVRAGYTKYALEESDSYGSDVSDKLKDVYYFKNDNNETKYFTVANILFQFNDEQQTKYDDLKSKIENNDGQYGYDELQAQIDSLYTQIVPVVRVENQTTGEYEVVEDSELSVDEIIANKIKIELKDAQATSSVNFIGDTINDLIYRYNEDPGMFNAEVPYVIGVDTEGKAVSSFVEEFNDAGLKLYNNGYGKVGDVEICKSQYGIHVLVYTGKCENLFNGIDSNFNLASTTTPKENAEESIEVLYSTRVNPLVDKTYFDVLYDELVSDNTSYFQSANANFLREDYEIKVYRGRIADSLKD